jgi:hypothetical protein
MNKRTLIGLVVLCSLVLAASACGKKKSDKAGAKSSGKTGAAGLVGSWTFNGKKSVAANEKMSKAPKKHQEQFIAMVNKATITITKDTMVVEGLGPKQTEKYKVLEDKGTTVLCESTNAKGKVEKATYIYVSDNELKVLTKDGKDIFFINRK